LACRRPNWRGGWADPKKTINEISLGNAAITHETALQLERVLGTPAHFWLNGEARYREFIARQEDEQCSNL
jgi:HTH-type transcriptional regulator / antitoxin HigA